MSAIRADFQKISAVCPVAGISCSRTKSFTVPSLLKRFSFAIITPFLQTETVASITTGRGSVASTITLRLTGAADAQRARENCPGSAPACPRAGVAVD